MPKVLIVATSRKTRGGITAVVKAHETGKQWRDWGCRWIETNIDTSRSAKILYFFRGLLQYIRFLPGCEIVHIHLSESFSAIRKTIFFALGKLARKKIIVHFHSFSPETTIRGKHWRIYRYLFSNADRVIVLSEMWKEYVNETFHLGDKVVVIYNPCNVSILNKQYIKQRQILYAGTLNSRKGYSDMIQAFAKIEKTFPDWKIIFAGNGEIETAKALAASLGIEDRTVFSGWVGGEQKDKIFKESTIFCLPSYAEGFPMAVLDAFAYGLPVITTPVGGIPDIAVDGQNMLLFNPGDINGLSEQMSRLIADEHLRSDLSKASLQLANTTFNIDTINRQIEELYFSLHCNKRPNGKQQVRHQ